MKKLDVLILKSFIGPFILTTVVCTFVLLTQYMLKYFDDFVGKDLGAEVFAELILYFSVNMMPVALPLGVLLSSLMTFGNLGEHFELTAIKSAGISLVRALMPIGVFVSFLTVGAFFFNNHVVPAANLKAYSLLFDIKNKKPALDIREGQFYGGIDGYSIKANEKFPDNKTLKEVIIYDHSQPSRSGNKTVILADSAIMYTVLNDRYLKFELYEGNLFNEISKGSRRNRLNSSYNRNGFDRMEMMFSLASFDLKETKEELFQNNRQMKNISELTHDIDSLGKRIVKSRENLYFGALGFYQFHYKDRLHHVRDSIGKERTRKAKEKVKKPEKQIDKFEPKTKEASIVDLGGFLYSLFDQEQELQKKKVQQQDTFKTIQGKKNVKFQQKKITPFPNRKINKTQSDRQKYEIQEVDPEDVQVPAERPNKNLKNSKKSKARFNSSKNTNKNKDKKKSNNAVNIQYKFIKLDTSLVTQTRDTLDQYFEKFKYKKSDILLNASQKVRNLKNSINTLQRKVRGDQKNIFKYTVEKYKKYSQAMACFIMFLIGAPLGAIIKKGGLGVPVIVSIAFFITYYVLTITSEKWAKEGFVDGRIAVWYANMILLPFGLYFLSRARVDARLFEWEAYVIWFQKLVGNKSK